MKKLITTSLFFLVFGLVCCQTPASDSKNSKEEEKTQKSMENNTTTKTDAEWKKILTPEQYAILREKGTERPGIGEYNTFSQKGAYACAACGTELFTSDQKFDSHCGWPSFDNNIAGGDRVKQVKDFSHGMIRTEIVCANCGGHLGHIFDDGPTATGQRYCVNSLSLKFIPENERKK